jgi:uncharacterized protein (TIGR03437 family)
MARCPALALILFSVHSPAATNFAAFSALPLRFEANRGQSGAGVDFLARGVSGTIFVGAHGAIVKPRGASPAFLDLADPIAPAAAEPLDPLASRSNYFLGRDRSAWRTGIANFGRVRYRHVWPGIDLVYYGDSNRLEYDFVVAPGADPRAIGFSVRAAGAVRVDRNGDLILADGIRQHKPHIYQDTPGGRRYIAARYALARGNRVSFRIGSYDRSLPLTIDPVMSYSTLFGGSGNDSAAGIAVDSSGSVYIAGTTDSSDLPASVAGKRFAGTPPDVFIAKLKPDGTDLIYCTYLGGEGDDEARAIAVDPAGNAYVTGVTFSAAFPATGGTVQSVYGLKGDAFVAKLGPAGTLIYATYLGGLNADEGRGIAADSDGNAYVTGVTSSGNFPVSTAAYQSKYQGGAHDGFVAKLGPAGTSLIYSTFLGSPGDDQPAAIAIDPAGNAYVTGSTDADDFPTTAAAYQTAASNPVSVPFVTKFNPAGTVAYSTYLGGEVSDAAKGIAADFAGNAYIAGVTSSTAFPTTDGALSTALDGPSDAFVTKLNAAGNGLVYSTYLGGRDADGATAIDIDLVGNAYIAGNTRSLDFPAVKALQQTPGGGVDGFVVKLDPKGAEIVYASYIGGAADETASAIAVDPLSNAYVTGSTSSPNFPTTPGAVRASLVAVDSFVVKFHDVDLPLIVADATSLSFSFDGLGTPPAAQIVHVTSTTGAVPITVATDTTWLQATPISGNTPVALSVTVNSARLALGSYKGNVVISALGAANSPVTIPVKFDFLRSGSPALPQPAVTPATIPAGSGDTIITINGSNFKQGATVQVNGTLVASTFLDSNTLTAVVPAAMLANPGALTVTVSNPGSSAPLLTLTVLVNVVLPVVAQGGVVNGASLLPGPVSAGEVIIINGNNLGPKDTVQAAPMNGSYPTTLGGTSVSFDGKPAALLAVGIAQIVAVVPFEVTGQKSTQFQVTFNGQKSTAATLAVAPAAPGVFTVDGSGGGQANAVNQDGTANGQDSPAPPGTLVTFLATGGGQTNPAGVDGALLTDTLPQLLLPAAVQMDGENCTDVTAAPAAGMISGIIQVTARVPGDLAGTVEAVVFIGGLPSQPGVTLEVQTPDATPASSRPGPDALRRKRR